jgi:hypothetical protein
MTEPKFTPGPWKVFDTPSGKIVGIGTEDGTGVTDRGFGVWGMDSEEAAATAALIAAAPDLFEALSEILSYSGGAANALEDPYVMERAHAALSKSLNTSSEKDAG